MSWLDSFINNTGVEHEEVSDMSHGEYVDTITWDAWPLGQLDDEDSIAVEDAILRSVASRYVSLVGVEGKSAIRWALREAGYCVFDGDEQFEILQHNQHRPASRLTRFLQRMGW